MIVETGAGLSNANSFVDATYFDAYFTNRGNSAAVAWLNPRKENNLVIATAYINARYRSRFKGRKHTQEQSLSWPRIGAAIDGGGAEMFIAGYGPALDGYIIPSNVIPTELKDAVCEMAWRVDTAEAAPDIEAGAGLVTLEKVGPIETAYSSRGPVILSAIWVYVDMLITPLLTGSLMSVPIVRS